MCLFVALVQAITKIKGSHDLQQRIHTSPQFPGMGSDCYPCQLELVSGFASPLDSHWLSVQILSNSISLFAFTAQSNWFINSKGM